MRELVTFALLCILAILAAKTTIDISGDIANAICITVVCGLIYKVWR